MILKWILDRLVSLIGLLVLWPVLVVIAILVRAKMPGGPVIFKQKRVGHHGKLFTMYKFRSMTANHSVSSVSVKYKLDELPELWNVLIGDMSFVGPRPDVPGYADKLQGADRRMLLLKPGITGPASLKYRNEEELLAKQEDPQKYNDEVLFPDKVKINIEYLDNWSFWYDIKIIIYTVLGKDL